MTPLTQQLEDKKKEYRSLKRQHCDDCTKDEECQTCKPEFDNLRKEIAILEQAIAEIKNIQSQENKTGNVEAKQSNSNRENKTGSANISNLLQKQRQDFAEKLKERIMRNGNLSRRVVENKDGEFEHKHDYVLNEIVCLIIDDELQQLNQPNTKQ